MQLLGYPTHAAFITETRMAKTPEAVKSFLQDLGKRLTPLAEAETQVLLKLKVESLKHAAGFRAYAHIACSLKFPQPVAKFLIESFTPGMFHTTVTRCEDIAVIVVVVENY